MFPNDHDGLEHSNRNNARTNLGASSYEPGQPRSRSPRPRYRLSGLAHFSCEILGQPGSQSTGLNISTICTVSLQEFPWCTGQIRLVCYRAPPSKSECGFLGRLYEKSIENRKRLNSVTTALHVTCYRLKYDAFMQINLRRTYACCWFFWYDLLSPWNIPPLPEFSYTGDIRQWISVYSNLWHLLRIYDFKLNIDDCNVIEYLQNKWLNTAWFLCQWYPQFTSCPKRKDSIHQESQGRLWLQKIHCADQFSLTN